MWSTWQYLFEQHDTVDPRAAGRVQDGFNPACLQQGGDELAVVVGPDAGVPNVKGPHLSRLPVRVLVGQAGGRRAQRPHTEHGVHL